MTPLPEPRADGHLPDLARPLHYTIELDVDPTKERFSGTTRIDVEIPAATSHVVLHAHALDVKDVRAIGDVAIPAKPSMRNAQGGKAPEELVLTFARPIPPGKTSLVITYDAPFDDELSGLYRVKDGDRWYAFTQFEATDARRAFPCFDEPGFKVPFDVAVTVPAGMIAVANSPENTHTEGGPKSTFRFHPTPPLPTYLVAFAVGELEIQEAQRVSRPPLRLITTKGKTGPMGTLGLEATSGLVDALGDWFGIPYPYAKLDIVAVPKFGPGAMENPGLVTFREERLLLDPQRAGTSSRRGQALIIAHELAHQWFGNLVTASWWNDVWLNEGMATWMEWRIVDKWRPSLGAKVDAVVSAHGVMDVDGLVTARAVRQPVVSTSDAQEAFDGITYEKGAAVLSTIERWVGEAAFQKGVREYLQTNAFKSVQADKLLSTLDKVSGKDVTAMASTFLDHAGVPEVSAMLECEPGGRWHVELSQEEWRPLGSKKPEQGQHTWMIPVCIRAQGDKKTQCADLMMGAPALVAGRGTCPTYIHPNSDASYYRFALTEKEAVKLAEARKDLDPAARISALSNAWAAVRSGKLLADVMLRVLPAFDDDQSRQVIGQVTWILSHMNHALIVEDDARAAFKKFVVARLGKRKAALGWTSKAKGDAIADEAIARQSVLWAMGELAEDEATLKEAEEQATKWLADPASIDSDVAGIALDLASRRATAGRLDQLRAAAKSAKTKEDRVLALRAMYGFDSAEVLGKALDLVLTDEIATHEVRYALGSAFARKTSRPIAEQWMRAHWDELRKKLPGGLSTALVRGAGVGCSTKEADERKEFYTSRLANVEGAARGLAESLESIALCAELREKAAPNFRRGLLNLPKK